MIWITNLTKLLRTTTAGVLLTGLAALAAGQNFGTPRPDFSKVNDYLAGKRLLLPYDDLFSLKRAANGSPSAVRTDLNKDLAFTSGGDASIPESRCTIFRGPKPARLFNTKKDWLVYLTGRAMDREYCGSAPGNANVELAWKDPNSTALQSSEDFAVPYLHDQQIIAADVNQDGYDDVILVDSGLIKIYSAVDVDNPAAALHQVAYSYFLNQQPISHAPASNG